MSKEDVDRLTGISDFVSDTYTWLRGRHDFPSDQVQTQIQRRIQNNIDGLESIIESTAKNDFTIISLARRMRTLKTKANRTSIVCTVTSCVDGATPQTVLLTGDITRSILSNQRSIMDCGHSFDVYKAQHHGTKTHYINHKDEKNKIRTKYLLISNGRTKLTRGKMNEEYCPVIKEDSEDYSLVCTTCVKEIAERCTKSNCNECVNHTEIVKGIKEDYDSVAINLDTQQVYSCRYR